MTIERAREEFPQWAMITVTGPQRRVIDDAEWTDAEPKKLEWKLPISDRARAFWKKHLILIVACLFLPLWTAGACWITASIVRHNTEIETEERVRHEMTGQMQNYIDRQEQERMASGLLTGEASKEAAIDSANRHVAGVISKLNTDDQKRTEASCMVARVMNPWYPNTFEEVVAQPSQWMFYDGSDVTYTPHDYELANQIVRPYLESGVIPNGLTAEMVHGSWSVNDYVLRDSYETTSTMHTWRWQG